MTTYAFSAQTYVDRPAAEVWDYVADYANDPAWRRGVTKMVPAPAGPAAEGTVTDEVMRLAGSTYRNLGVVTRVVPRQSFAWRTTEGADAHGSRTVTRLEDGGALVTLELTVTLHGLQRLAAPLLRRNLTGDAERLRQALSGRRDGAARA
ncbi:SRPBCC family protein [Dactylosporangium sp. CS-033363]|uniref:SRPBCC family protein n=1 Tax=Dactylosporangium sp. CS-033363 TaxID=3239935 RepID=UPI003D8A01D0